MDKKIKNNETPEGIEAKRPFREGSSKETTEELGGVLKDKLNAPTLCGKPVFRAKEEEDKVPIDQSGKPVYRAKMEKGKVMTTNSLPTEFLTGRVYELSENLIKFEVGDKRGIINNEHVMLGEPEYQDVVYLGHNRVMAEIEGKWGVIDEKGNIILNFEYDRIGLASSDYNTLIVEKNGKSELVPMITGE